MSESLLRRSRLLPLAAIGASTLSLTGCVLANIGTTSSFVFGCPPETPSPKVSEAHYTGLPSDRGKIRVEFSCVNNATGAESAPLRVEKGTKPFDPSIADEREYEFDVNYGVNIEAADPQPAVFSDPSNPNTEVIAIKGGIVNFEGVSRPDLVTVMNGAPHQDSSLTAN